MMRRMYLVAKKSPLGTLGKGRSLPGLPGKRRKRRAEQNIGTLEKLTENFDLIDEELAEWSRTLGDQGQAKRLLKLKREGGYPYATLPELICLDWLLRRGIEFIYQQGILGGRLYQGGVVPDLIVYQGRNAIVWQVNGNYWHTRPGMEQRDIAASQILLGREVYGHIITAVVALWERKLIADANLVCNAALIGLEMGM